MLFPDATAAVVTTEDVPEEDESDEYRFESVGYLVVDLQEDGADDSSELPYPQRRPTEDDCHTELDYPKLRKAQEQVYSRPAISRYRPPVDTSMGPPNFPPAARRSEAGPSRPPAFEGFSGRTRFKPINYSQWWEIPGAIFTIPYDWGRLLETFMRWESITKKVVAMQGFTDAKDKAEFIGNLLGETEKLYWIQWRMAFPAEYEELLSKADGRQGTQNIISQIRRLFTLEDPDEWLRAMQYEALGELERLSCDNIKNIQQYMNEYLRLASKIGREFISEEELSEKFWLKMPRDLGRKIKAAYEERYPDNLIGVIHRVRFAYKYLENVSKEAALMRSLKNFKF
ncbi:uncharacterized protein LOC141831201 [Curcuma longa]|uniref:uncharacterized protein LOC141831201 n=1 Tax=Curcuma longa TaxID=136217 RepID=UPI003D9DF332